MCNRLTRQQLHALVWETPMTKLAKEFGLSDVALHKICRKHRIPTPPVGYWAKKAHGKRVATTPLPEPSDETEIVVRESSASNEPLAIAEARIAMTAAIDVSEPDAEAANPIVERTVTKLSKSRARAGQLVQCKGQGVVSVAVRPESVDRAAALLRALVATGERAGLKLTKHEAGAAWLCDGETIGFELIELTDQVAHVATQQELDAVAKWKREREETHRRFGYWRDWGEPKIPKWEQRYQGRLAIKLEEVRIESERSPWGETIIRTFADTRTRDVAKMIPRIFGTIAAMAAAKKANRGVGVRRRAAAEEAARRRAEAERRRVEDEQARSFLEQLVKEQEAGERLRALLDALQTNHGGNRVARFIAWAEARLTQIEQGMAPAAIEERLAKARLFGSEG